MAVDKQYLEQAKQMLAGSLENQNIQLQNSFSQNVQGLEGQKAGVNQNFDKQLEQNAINTTNAQNQYLNNSLARGLGRSTIATSGAAGIKDSGNRIANNVNTDRTNALDNIEAQKVKLSEALQASLLGLSANFESQQLTLAQQLADSAYAKQWQEGQFAYQKEQDAIANAMAQAKFDYQKQQDAMALAAARRSGGSGGSGTTAQNVSGTQAPAYTNAWSDFGKQLENYMYKGDEAGSPMTWLKQSGLARTDPDAYAEMTRVAQEAQYKRYRDGGRVMK